MLSPRGAGFDCHRTWEALYFDAIPVVRSSCMDSLYSDLPVLIIDDWKKITEEFLRQKLVEMKKLKYNKSKMYFQYWKDLILSYK